MTKAALKAELIAALTVALDTARRAHAAAIEGATHAEAKPENDKDTRGLEQSYLARGQAQRVAELEAGLADVTALAFARVHRRRSDRDERARDVRRSRRAACVVDRARRGRHSALR